jgi:hypothetical protein
MGSRLIRHISEISGRVSRKERKAAEKLRSDIFFLCALCVLCENLFYFRKSLLNAKIQP